jgi:hypothetical protein
MRWNKPGLEFIWDPHEQKSTATKMSLKEKLRCKMVHNTDIIQIILMLMDEIEALNQKLEAQSGREKSDH